MTEVASLTDTVLDVLSDVLGVSVGQLQEHPVLAAYEWDSLSSLEALAQLEGRLRIVLDLRAYQAVRTVAELVELADRSPRRGAQS